VRHDAALAFLKNSLLFCCVLISRIRIAMFLKNVRLTNFKCHESLFMDFATGEEGKSPVRKTTFLVGENGTGKTALLQAIALVTAGSEALRTIPGLPDNFIQAKKRFCAIEATITTAQGEERKLSLRLERGQSLAQIVSNAKTSLAPMDAALRHTERSYFTAGYGSSRRLDTGNTTTARRDKATARFAAIRSLFNEDASFRPLDALADAVKDGGGTAGVNALRDALNTFLPLEVRFKGFARNGSGLQFDTPDGLLPLSLLSNGYQQTVAWVSDLVYHLTRTFGDYQNPLAARGLLLIDEIDLHLHPAWQRQIHAFLTHGLPNMQVIATTYSPLTAQQAGRDELYALRRDEAGKIALVPFIGDPSWMLLHQLLMSPMFGLETDESVKAESEKAAARSKALRGRKAAMPAKAAGASSMTSAAKPEQAGKVNTRTNSTTDAADISLLQQINSALKSANDKGSKP
jgi:hypothetical protein